MKMTTVFALSITLNGLMFTQTVKSAELTNFNAEFHVKVAGFNLGTGTHKFNCQQHICTLESSAKPSGFVRNFFKDELYETSVLLQTENHLQWQSYTKREVKYKNDQPQDKWSSLKVDNNQIVYSEKNQQFPLSEIAFDPTSIAYAFQWYRLNDKTKDDFEHIKLQTFKEQVPIRLQDFAQTTKLAVDFATQPLTAEHYQFETEEYKAQVWLLKDYRWFPGKIQILNKSKDRVIILNLAKAPSFQNSTGR